jgi:acetyltransferase-like isoleucine patch superfamily enzyme
MRNFRYVIRTSNHPAARAVRSAVFGARNFTLPVPRLVVLPVVKLFLALRAGFYWTWRVLVCEPFFKVQCARYGTGVHTGTFLHWIMGAGDIVVGDRVRIEGKCSFVFASVLPDRPVLEIGDDTYVNHLCTFIVAQRVTIGRNVMVAANVTIFDSPGHPLDAERRIAGLPPSPEEIRPVAIGDKVWIGTGARIFPGVTIGEGSVVGMDSLVTKDVPPYTLVAGVPAKPIRSLRPDLPVERPGAVAAALDAAPAAV